MNNIFEANYFDGLSSVSKKVKITFYNTTDEFRLRFADGTSFVWQLKDLQFQKYNYLLEIRNNNYSEAILKIEDEYFTKIFYDAMKQNKRVDIHTRVLNLGNSIIITISACLFGLMILFYFYLLPPIAEKTALLLPESIDNTIGNEFMKSFLKENEIDTLKTKYLKQFTSELNLKNKKPLQFTVVKSKEINAFALPSGQIVIYSSILKNMKTPNELVALLGHEASHVNHRHTTKMLCRNLAGYMLISLILGDINGVMAVLVENTHQIHSLSYSRGFENEADEQGLKILMDNNLNPNGMIKLMDQLEKESEIAIPEIFSTHPLTKERKENIKKIISKTAYTVKPNEKLNAIFQYIKN
ncbi:MAG: M48 family metallopeptidase [Pseudarcicella sp.]|nr:M48 family metallopeptidase [Pseudarcicella sp.]